MILYRIIVGLRDQGTRSKLLRESNLTLESTITLVRSHELADEQLQRLAASGLEISAVRKNKKQSKQKPQISSNDGGHSSRSRASGKRNSAVKTETVWVLWKDTPIRRVSSMG